MATITANTGSGNSNVNGTWVGSVQPGAGDDVVIPATAVVTIPAAVTMLARSVTISTGGTLAFAATTSVLTIGTSTPGTGNVAFSNAGTITLTGIGTINFISTSTTQQTITTGGATMPNQTFNGAAGSWIFSDNNTSTGGITTTQGTFNTGSKTINTSFFSVGGSALTRNISFGSSAITVTSTGSAFQCLSTSGLTFNSTTAIVTLTGVLISANSIILIGFNWNGLSFVLNGGVAAGASAVISTGGGAIVGSFTITGASNVNGTYTFSSTMTVTGTLTLNGNSNVNRILVSSNTPGSSRTITCSSAPSLSNVDFQDITAAGAGGTWSGTLIGDALGNSNITFTRQSGGTNNSGNGVNMYWIGNLGTASNTAHWSFSSGGTTAGVVPLPQDDIFIDANSYSITTQRIQFDMPRVGRNIDTTGTNQTGATFGSSSGLSNFIFGNLTIGGTMNVDGNASGGWVFSGRGSQTVTSNGSTQQGSSTVQAPGGTYTLQDDFIFPVSNRTLTFAYGTFDANGHNLRAQVFTISATMTLVKMGSGTWDICLTNGGGWNMNAAISVLQCQTSTISWSTIGTTTKTFTGGGATYNIMSYTVAGSTANLVITGNNYFDTWNFSDATNARTLTLTVGTIQIVKNINGVVGTSGKLMSIVSSTSGTPAYLSIVGAPSANDWLSVKDIFATEPYKFYVGSNTTNVSGNTNLNTGTAAAVPYVRFNNYLNTSGGSPTITAPSILSANAGDLMVLEYFWASTPGTVTPPAGFTQTQAINSGTGGAFGQVFYKVAVGGETSWATTTVNAPGIVGVKIVVIGGWTGTPTLDVTDNNNSAGSSVTTLSTGSGVSNTTSLGLAIGSWVANGITGTTSFSNSFEEARVLTQSSNVLTAVLPLTSTGSRTSTAVWTSAHIASSQLAVFKDVAAVASKGNFLMLF